MAYELAQAYVQIIPTTKGIESKLDNLLGKDADKAGKNAGGIFSASFSGAIKGLGKATAAALMAGTGALAAFSATAVKTGMEFDSSMSQVAATMGMSMEEMMEQTGSVDLAWGTFTGNLREYAQEIGSRTAYSATQASEALNFMALAGYDAQTSMEMLPNVLNLAAAGNMDLALASDMVTDTQSALGLSLEETATMVDQMAKTSSKSNTSVEQLGDAMLKIGATARSVKGGTQELSTVLGVLADNGIKGSEGGTHLRNIMLSLQSAAEDGSVVFGDYAVDIYDADGNMRSLVDIIGETSDAMGDLSDEAKSEVLSGIFNKTDLAAVNALLGTSKDRYAELAEEIGKASGAAQEMADTQLDNLEGDITLFKSALEGTQIALSDLLTPALRDFVQIGSDGLERVTEALKGGDISAAAEEFGGLVSEGITKVVENLPQAIEAGGQLMRGIMQGVTDNVDSIADGIAEVAVSIAEFFGENTGPFISGAIKIATSVAGALIEHLPDILIGLGEGIVEGVFAIVEGLPEMLSGVVGSIWDIFGDWDGLTDEYLEETGKIIDSSDEIEEAWGKVQTAKDEQFQNAEQEYAYYNGLVTELDGIVDANGRVKKGYEDRAKFILGELSEATGVESELIGNRIDEYDAFEEKIKDVIEAQRVEAILAAEKTAYEAAISNQQEIAAQMSEVKTQLDEAADAYENLKESAAAKDYVTQKMAMSMGQISYDEAVKMMEAWALEESGLEGLQAEYGELEAALGDTYTTMGQYEADFKNASEGNYEAVGQAVRNWTADSKESYTQNKQDLEALVQQYEINLEAVQKAVEEGRVDEAYLEKSQNLLDGAKADLENLNAEWDTKISEIASNLPGEMEKVSTEMGTLSKGIITSFVGTMSAGESSIRTSAEKASSAAEQPFKDFAKNAPKTGADVVDGSVQGVKGATDNLVTAMEEVAREAERGFKDFLGIQSPSTVMEAAGEDLMAGLANGIDSGSSDVTGKASDAGSDAVDAVNEYYDSFQSAGESLMNGIAVGMQNNSGEVSRIARQAVKDALAAAKEEGDIKSPSKKMAWIGEMLMAGLAQGIVDNAPTEEVAKTVNDLNSAMESSLDFGTPLDGYIDSMALDTLNRTVGVYSSNPATGETNIYITNNIDGATDPEEYARRLVRQIQIEMRMA